MFTLIQRFHQCSNNFFVPANCVTESAFNESSYLKSNLLNISVGVTDFFDAHTTNIHFICIAFANTNKTRLVTTPTWSLALSTNNLPLIIYLNEYYELRLKSL